MKEPNPHAFWIEIRAGVGEIKSCQLPKIKNRKTIKIHFPHPNIKNVANYFNSSNLLVNLCWNSGMYFIIEFIKSVVTSGVFSIIFFPDRKSVV